MIRKFMMTVALGSLAVGGLAATHLAYAQGDGPREGRRGGPMAMADANKDGNLTKAELTAATQARFARMDVDKDGKLTPADRAAMRAQRIDDRFARLDADKSGQISKAEFATPRAGRGAEGAKPEGAKPEGRGWGGRHHRGGGRDHGKGMMGGGFGRGMMDANKDGTVTQAEFTAGAMAMFDKADANKDGTVTAAEQQAARTAMRAAWKDRKAAPAQN